ncbi:hypothetical protein B0J17DRAFT_668809 [Rhizoctonia solani]|nr:hypothetical protein B0J17DRAFT_668809 [Rhizoctonia solani]
MFDYARQRYVLDIVCPLLGCDRKFEKLSQLKIHLSFKLKIQAYTCDKCPKSFANKGNFDRHKATICRNQCDYVTNGI